MKTAIPGPLAFAMICAAFVVGCGTSYVPREPDRIHFLMSGKGEDVLEKGGKRYSTSAFSGDLIEAVAGHPTAEGHARICVHRQRIAGSLAVVGGVALVPAYIFAAESITGLPENRPTMATAAVCTLLGSLAAIASAAIVGESGAAHCYDAINVYNDDVFKNRRRASR